MSLSSKVIETGVSNVYCSFDLLKEELQDFMKMIELEGNSSEGVRTINNEVQKHLNSVKEIEEKWIAYLVSLVSELQPEERATWSIKGDSVNVITHRIDSETPYSNNIPMDVFIEVVEILINNAEEYTNKVIKTSHIEDMLGRENLIRRIEKYKDKPVYLINLIFRVLLIESILKRTKGNNYQLIKSAEEIRKWKNELLNK